MPEDRTPPPQPRRPTTPTAERGDAARLGQVLWRPGAAAALGALVGFYHTQQHALFPDGVLSAGALALALLLSLVLGRRVQRKVLALGVTPGPLLLALSLGSWVLVSSGRLLLVAPPPALLPQDPCGGFHLSPVLIHSGGMPLARLDVLALPLGFVLLYLLPALVGGLTAGVAAFSVGAVGQQLERTKPLALWCAVAAWLGVGLHNWLEPGLLVHRPPLCPALEDIPGGQGGLVDPLFFTTTCCAFLVLGEPLALLGSALGAFLRRCLAQLPARDERTHSSNEASGRTTPTVDTEYTERRNRCGSSFKPGGSPANSSAS